MPRLNLQEIEHTLSQTKAQWPAIQDLLLAHGVPQKDVPFNAEVMQRMLCAYDRLDDLLAKAIDLFSNQHLDQLCALNDAVHYGDDAALRQEFATAIATNKSKFEDRVPAISRWYRDKCQSAGTHKLAAKVYVSVLGMPQLFYEGNHRTGALIASWINVSRGEPPFVLSPGNAVGFFHPSSQIKDLTARSYWRGRHKLPKYHKSFRRFWEAQSAEGWQYLRNAPSNG